MDRQANYQADILAARQEAGSPLQKHVANCLNKFAAAAVIKHCKKEKEQL